MKLASSSSLCCLPDFMRQLGKLRLHVATFLEIEIDTIIDRIDNNRLAAPAGKKDEGLLDRGAEA